MNKVVEKALRKLFGEDEAALAAFVAEVDGVNRTVSEKGMIYRANEAGETVERENEGAEEQEDGDEENEGGDALLEIDDETVAFIVQQVAQHPDVAALLGNALAQVTALEERLNVAEKAVATATRQAGDMRARLAALEADEAEKRQTWQEDLSARQNPKLKVTYRPRTRRAVDEDGEDMEVTGTEIAESILATLPTY